MHVLDGSPRISHHLLYLFSTPFGASLSVLLLSAFNMIMLRTSIYDKVRPHVCSRGWLESSPAEVAPLAKVGGYSHHLKSAVRTAH